MQKVALRELGSPELRVIGDVFDRDRASERVGELFEAGGDALGGIAREFQWQELVESAPGAAREGEVIGVPQRVEPRDFVRELRRVLAIRRARGADRQREPVRDERVIAADALERRRVVAAAAHVVFGRDLEERDVLEHGSLEYLFQELPAQAEPNAALQRASGSGQHELTFAALSRTCPGHSRPW